MKFINRIGVAAACLAWGVAQLNAIPVSNPLYQDVDSFGSANLGVLLSPWQSVSGVFDIANNDDSTPSWTVYSGFANYGMTYFDVDGFIPGAGHRIEEATAYFYLASLDRVERFDVELHSTGVFTGSGYRGRLILEGDLNPGLLVTLSETGQIEYQISNVGEAGTGSFRVKAAQLQVTAVPDGGTSLMLLGTALLGICGLRRKLA